MNDFNYGQLAAYAQMVFLVCASWLAGKLCNASTRRFFDKLKKEAEAELNEQRALLEGKVKRLLKVVEEMIEQKKTSKTDSQSNTDNGT